MKKYIKPFFILFLGMFFFNLLLQGFLLRQWNDSHLTELRNAQIQPLIVVINYLIQSAGLLFFLVKLKAFGNPRAASVIGALYGFLLFMNLGLLNLFLIRGYPWEMVISDTLVTMLTYAAACALASFFSRSQTERSPI